MMEIVVTTKLSLSLSLSLWKNPSLIQQTMASAEDQDIVPTIIALGVIGITIHLTNGLGILTTLIAKLNLKRKAIQKASEAAAGSVAGVFIHPGKYLSRYFRLVSNANKLPFFSLLSRSQVPQSRLLATSST